MNNCVNGLMMGHLLLVLVGMAVMPASEGFHFEWLVPEKLHKCCEDIMSLDPDCKTVSGGFSFNGSTYFFFGDYFMGTTIRPNGFPEILVEQSVKPVQGSWDFPGDEGARKGGFGQDWERLKAKIKVDAALALDDTIFIKRGETYSTFAGIGQSLGIDSDCSQLHPALCSHGSEKVDASAVYIGSKGSRYIQVYSQELDADGGYSVTFYKGKKLWYSYRLTSKDDDTVDAISIFKRVYDYDSKTERIGARLPTNERESSKSTMNYGLYFNEHGYACNFQVHSKALEAKEPLRFERKALVAGVPMVECMPVQVFMGCPQSWCYRNDVDDIIVTKSASETGSLRDMIVVYRGHYYWKADPEKGVPIIPGDVKHQFLSMTNSGENYKSLSYVDAAEAVEWSNNLFLFYFIDNKLIIYKGIFGDSEVHSKGKNRPDRRRRLGIDKQTFSESDVYDDLEKIFPGIACEVVDTLWYNRRQRKLILFCGAYLQIYGVAYDRAIHMPIFKAEGGKVLIDDQLYGIAEDIDSVFSLGDYAYFLKGQWYWKVSIDNWQNERKKGTPLKAMPSFGDRNRNSPNSSYGLFATRQRCGYSLQTMEKIKERLSPYAPGVGERETGRLPSAEQRKGTQIRSQTIVIFVLAAILGIALVLGAAFYFTRRRTFH